MWEDFGFLGSYKWQVTWEWLTWNICQIKVHWWIAQTRDMRLLYFSVLVETDIFACTHSLLCCFRQHFHNDTIQAKGITAAVGKFTFSREQDSESYMKLANSWIIKSQCFRHAPWKAFQFFLHSNAQYLFLLYAATTLSGSHQLCHYCTFTLLVVLVKWK